MLTLNAEYRHVDTLFITADGHFGLPRKDKIDDPDDVSLLSGRGIFPVDADFQKYLADVGDSPEVCGVYEILFNKEPRLRAGQKSTCAKLNAVEMQNKLKFRGCKVTGVVSVNCARHNLFRFGSMVDLYKGERYAPFSNYIFMVVLTWEADLQIQTMQSLNLCGWRDMCAGSR